MGKEKQPKAKKQLAPAWLEPAWSALARRLAVAAGSASVVVSLLAEVPLLPAVGRGALAWISVMALFRVGGRLVGSRVLEDRPDGSEASGSAPDADSVPAPAPARRVKRA